MKASIVGITLVNIAIRALWVLNVHPAPRSDFAFYFSAATRLAAGQGYTLNGEPTAFWPAGWPVVLAAAFRIFGSELWVGLALQLAIATGISVLIVLLAHRVSGSWVVGTAASLAWTILPGELGWNSVLGTEPLFTLLTVGALLVLAYGTNRGNLIIAGVLLGAACWVRPTVLLLPVGLAVLLIVEHRSWRIPIAKAALVLGVMLVVIAPLTARNYATFGAFVPVSTNGGVNLWQGLHTDSGYWWSTDPQVNPLVAVDDEVERDRLGQRLFLQHAAEHPLDVAAHAAAKIASLYGPPSTLWIAVAGGWGERKATIIMAGAAIAYIAFMLAAAAGLLWTWTHRRWPMILILGFCVYYTAVWSVFPAWDRFRYPLMPLFAVFAGVAIVRTWGLAREIFWLRRSVGPTP